MDNAVMPAPSGSPVPASSAAVLEFVGASHETIGEAVRHALARASQLLSTLEGAGVTVIPHIHPEAAPRYRVTLQVTTGDPSDPPAKRA
jgi:flavin-binding protein dodecin